MEWHVLFFNCNRRPGRKTSGFRTVRTLKICRPSGLNVMSPINYPPIRIWKHNDGSAEREETGESANGDCQETFQVISLRNMHICEFHIASQFAIFIFLYHFLQIFKVKFYLTTIFLVSTMLFYLNGSVIIRPVHTKTLT